MSDLSKCFWSQPDLNQPSRRSSGRSTTKVPPVASELVWDQFDWASVPPQSTDRVISWFARHKIIVRSSSLPQSKTGGSGLSTTHRPENEDRRSTARPMRTQWIWWGGQRPMKAAELASAAEQAGGIEVRLWCRPGDASCDRPAVILLPPAVAKTDQLAGWLREMRRIMPRVSQWSVGLDVSQCHRHFDDLVAAKFDGWTIHADHPGIDGDDVVDALTSLQRKLSRLPDPPMIGCIVGPMTADDLAKLSVCGADQICIDRCPDVDIADIGRSGPHTTGDVIDRLHRVLRWVGHRGRNRGLLATMDPRIAGRWGIVDVSG